MIETYSFKKKTLISLWIIIPIVIIFSILVLLDINYIIESNILYLIMIIISGFVVKSAIRESSIHCNTIKFNDSEEVIIEFHNLMKEKLVINPKAVYWEIGSKLVIIKKKSTRDILCYFRKELMHDPQKWDAMIKKIEEIRY